MSKYVVASVYYNYNDEYYYSEDENVGTAVKVFDNIQNAKSFANRKTMQELKGLDLSEYCYDHASWDGVVDQDKLVQFKEIASKIDNTFDYDNKLFTIPQDVKGEDLRELFETLTLKLYCIQKVD